MADSCKPFSEDVVHELKNEFGSNASNWIEALERSRKGVCNGSDVAHGIFNESYLSHGEYGSFSPPQYGKIFYAYLSPIIILVGLFGNGISVKVFRRKSLRRLSASLYLSAISISDSLVLLTYVLFGWFDKGLPLWPSGHHLPIIHIHGVCQTFVFFSYVFRFVSVWLIVVFTVERYIAACRPLKRRIICTKTFGRRAIMVVCLLAVCVSVFKPVLTGIYDTPRHVAVSSLENKNNVFIVEEESPDFAKSPSKMCTRNPDYVRLSFALELIYGLLITGIPFVIIAVFNMLIIHRLVRRDAALKKLKMMFKDCRIRWEFTITLLVVSSCFVCLNLPYFVLWCNQFVQTMGITPEQDFIQTLVKTARRRNSLFVTKTIFYLNYCVNFFLYLLTGRYYRGELKALFLCQDSAVRKKGSSGGTFTRSTSPGSTLTHGVKDMNALLQKDLNKERTDLFSDDITKCAIESCSTL